MLPLPVCATSAAYCDWPGQRARAGEDVGVGVAAVLRVGVASLYACYMLRWVKSLLVYKMLPNVKIVRDVAQNGA